MNQLKMVSLEMLVPKNHTYRRYKKLLDFRSINAILHKIETDHIYKGYGLPKLFRCLLLQFMENISDRELERFLQENNAGKFFCEFELDDITPDHTVFTRARQRIGTKKLASLFRKIRNQLKNKGYMSECFTMVDASHLVAKNTIWAERDKLIAAKKAELDKLYLHQENIIKLNNKNLPQVAFDSQARLGCKGKDMFWYGYKKHVSVDMKYGLINKVALTPANVPDGKGLKHICTANSTIYADKGYCGKQALSISKQKGSTLLAIKRNNMLNKDRELDKRISKLRAPFERVFARQNRRVRYVGIAKNQFAEFMYAICFNMKRLVSIDSPNLGFRGTIMPKFDEMA